MAASYATDKLPTHRVFQDTDFSKNKLFIGSFYDATTTFVVEGSPFDCVSNTMVISKKDTADRDKYHQLPHQIFPKSPMPTVFDHWYRANVEAYHRAFSNDVDTKETSLLPKQTIRVKVNKEFCEIYQNEPAICKKLDQVSRADLLNFVADKSDLYRINNEIVISPAPADLLGFFYVNVDNVNDHEAKAAACKMRDIFVGHFTEARNKVGVWKCEQNSEVETFSKLQIGKNKLIKTCEPVKC